MRFEFSVLCSFARPGSSQFRPACVLSGSRSEAVGSQGSFASCGLVLLGFARPSTSLRAYSNLLNLIVDTSRGPQDSGVWGNSYKFDELAARHGVGEPLSAWEKGQ